MRTHAPELLQKAWESFGTWPVLPEYAGVRLVRWRTSQNVTPDQLIKKIRRRCGNLHSMRAMFVRKADYPLYRDALAMFGTWQNALAQAEVNRDRLYFGTKNPRSHQVTALELLSAADSCQRSSNTRVSGMRESVSDAMSDRPIRQLSDALEISAGPQKLMFSRHRHKRSSHSSECDRYGMEVSSGHSRPRCGPSETYRPEGYSVVRVGR